MRGERGGGEKINDSVVWLNSKIIFLPQNRYANDLVENFSAVLLMDNFFFFILLFFKHIKSLNFKFCIFFFVLSDDVIKIFRNN